jgi:hypothetical protein
MKKRELIGRFRSHEIGQLIVEWTWVTQIIILEKEFGIDATQSFELSVEQYINITTLNHSSLSSLWSKKQQGVQLLTEQELFSRSHIQVLLDNGSIR